MNNFVVCCRCCLHHCLAHGRVGMHGLYQIMPGEPFLAGNYQLGNHLRHIGSHQMRPQQLAVGGIENHSPTDATSGVTYVQPGMLSYLIGSGSSPAIFSTQQIASADATCAKACPCTMSPMA